MQWDINGKLSFFLYWAFAWVEVCCAVIYFIVFTRFCFILWLSSLFENNFNPCIKYRLYMHKIYLGSIVLMLSRKKFYSILIRTIFDAIIVRDLFPFLFWVCLVSLFNISTNINSFADRYWSVDVWVIWLIFCCWFQMEICNIVAQ